MNRPAAAMAPGKANRRFIMLAVVLGLLGAVLVYVAFARTKSSGTSSTGGESSAVVVARQDIPARTKITPSMVEVRLLSSDIRSTLGYTDVTQVVNKITRFPVSANEQILSNKIVDVSPAAATTRSLAFVVPSGMRAMAVTVKPVSTAGGLVLPGDYIDILGVYDVEFQSSATDPTARQKVTSYYANTLLQAKEVLAVSQTVVDIVPESNTTPADTTARVRNSEAKPDPQAVTITLALSPDEAEKLFLAEKNGDLRFTVRNFSDTEERPVTPLTNRDLLPPLLPNPFLTPR